MLDRVTTVMGKMQWRSRKKIGSPCFRDVTIDMDATQIVAEKAQVRMSYQGKKGYLPLVGHVRKLSGIVRHEELRDRNRFSGTGHVPFLESCLRRLPERIRVTLF